MKFSDLPPYQRTQLAALASCGGGGLDTKQLSMSSPISGDAKRGAAQLLELRRTGLVYSTERQTGQQYVKWFITDVGLAVFEGRPDGDVVVVPAEQCDLHQAATEQCPKPAAKVWRVQDASGQAVADISTSSEALALKFLQKQAEAHPGLPLYLVTTVAKACLPKPAATITRV